MHQVVFEKGDCQPMHYDVFNGDADGIFALHQYRLNHPAQPSRLVTGVKRDIRLLSQIEHLHNCFLTVFDISIDLNRNSLGVLLRQNNSITYFDHHFAGEPLFAPLLLTHIDNRPSTCTSLIVNNAVHGRYGLWSICGAFGDNVFDAALKLARAYHLDEQQTQDLRRLGELFNYNGYGTVLDDLLFHPADLYTTLKPFSDPFEYLANSPNVDILETQYRTDLTTAMQVKEYAVPGKNRCYHFPDTPWARRIVGVFSNVKAREKPTAAHVVISDNPDGTYRVSVRAPFENMHHADTLCKLYPTGGGRAAAAGINQLPKEMLDHFLNAFCSQYN